MYKSDVCVCVCVYNEISFSHKNKEILPFATTWMDFEGITLSQISQAEKDKYQTISIICGIFLKNSKERNQLTEKEIRFLAATFEDRRRNGMVVRRYKGQKKQK